MVARELTRLGIAHQTGVGKTGVVGLIEGGRPGPVLAIRADMDALPIEEKTGLPFASTNLGLMHACGHDIHTTTLLGVAAVLKELAPQLAGTVKLVFQPAEEAYRRHEGDDRRRRDGRPEDRYGAGASTTTRTCRWAPLASCTARAWRQRTGFDIVGARQVRPRRVSASRGRSDRRRGDAGHAVADRRVA